MYTYAIYRLGEFDHPEDVVERIERDTKMTLEELQTIVRGRIQLVRIPLAVSRDPKLESWVVVNEDPQSLPWEDSGLNCAFMSVFYKEICGTAIVASANCFEY